MMTSHAFALKLIKNGTVLDYEEFTQRAIQVVLANELANDKFVSALEDFNSFEGLDDKFCVNFTGAWLKYALNDKPDKVRLNSTTLIRAILGQDFEEKEMVTGTCNHLLSDEIYRKINWIEDLDAVEEDHSDQSQYILKKCLKQRSNNSTHEISIVLLRPDDFLDIITSSRSVSEYRSYFIQLAKIRRTYQKTYLPWILANKNKSISRLEQKLDKQSENFKQFQAETKKRDEEQTKQMSDQTKQMNEQTGRIEQLLQIGNKLIGQNDTLQLTVDMTREQLADSLDSLVNKSYHSTIDPDNEAKITHIAVLAPKTKDRKGKTILVRGQVMHIKRRKSQTADTHEPVIDMTYNANAINLIENAKQEFLRARDSYIDEFNRPIIEFNAKLYKEIGKHNRAVKKYNKANPTVAKQTRNYLLERMEKITIANIPITFNNVSIIYKPNKHFSYDEVVGFISSMNKKTQASPIQSGSEQEDSS